MMGTMKIFISSQLFKNRTPIYEDSKISKNILKKKIQVIFTDGTLSIELMKTFYLHNMDCYIVVRNLEFFYSKISLFRNVNLEIVDRSLKNEENDKMRLNIKNYKEIEKKLKSNNIEKGVEISFNPNVYEGIKTSFLKSDIYLSSEALCHKIYKEVKNGKVSLDDLEKIDVSKEKIYKTLKSMIYCGILTVKENFVILNEILK
jgi:hypothetical protein